jgi:hypothetical protein
MEIVDVVDDIQSVESLLIAHDERKKEIEAREEMFSSVIAEGEQMIDSGHRSSEEVNMPKSPQQHHNNNITTSLQQHQHHHNITTTSPQHHHNITTTLSPQHHNNHNTTSTSPQH